MNKNTSTSYPKFDSYKITCLVEDGKLDIEKLSENIIHMVRNKEVSIVDVFCLIESLTYFEDSPMAILLCQKTFSQDEATDDMKRFILDEIMDDGYLSKRYEKAMKVCASATRKHQMKQ